MGKHKMKLSDMIPNAWFYKLKDMSRTSKHTHSLRTNHRPPPPPSSPLTSTVNTTPKSEPQCHSRKSYHITRELTIDHLKSPPRKSKSSSKSRKSTRRSSSISSFTSQSTSTSLSSRSPPSFEEADPIVRKIDDVGILIEDALLKVKKEYFNEQSILDRNAAPPHSEHFNIVVDKFNHQLPPIITKQQTRSKTPTHNQIKEQRNSPPSRRMSVSSPGGMRLKINSPKIIGRKQGQNVGKKSTNSKKRRSISESFAVVKSSFDPQTDFKESMVEMIVQNNLTAAKDLQDLLTCYLTLNLDEYHDLIIKVFKQIWCDLRHPT